MDALPILQVLLIEAERDDGASMRLSTLTRMVMLDYCRLHPFSSSSIVIVIHWHCMLQSTRDDQEL